MLHSKGRRSPKHQISLRSIFYWARFLHIYTSALLFTLLIFFCVTGFFLNHLEWFSGTSEDASLKLSLPEEVATALYSPEKELVAENININSLGRWLKSQYGLQKLNSVEYDLEMGEVVLDYALPAGYASAIYLIEDRQVVLDYRKGDIVAVMNDLHKGRHSGAVWSWVIDISALLMVFFAVTGFVIMFQNKKHRRLAIAFSLLGFVSPIFLYFVFVPRLLGGI